MPNDNIHHLRQSFDAWTSEPVFRRVQLLGAGSIHVGIFADEIATIAEWREPTPLPHAPKSVLGIVSLQGRMLTVLALASLAVGDTASSDAASSDAPGNTHGHLVALRGDEQLALAVDQVGATIEIGDVDFDGKRETAGTLVQGILHHGGLDIKLLNPKELFSTAIQGRERRRRRF